MNWDDARLFLAIAEEGSFRRTAIKLNLGHSTLSRRIESLEENLGVQLFNRSTTGLTLTPSGEEMVDTAKIVSSEFDQLKVRLFGRDQLVKGRIVLTLPGILLNHLIMPMLVEFQKKWPEITLEIITGFEKLDLNAKEADVAIRLTSNPDEHFIGRCLGSFHQAVYASQYYLDSYLAAKGEAAHQWIRPGEASVFDYTLARPYESPLPIESSLIVPDINAQMEVAIAGRGLATLPCFMGDPCPDLVRLSSSKLRADIWLLSHKDLRNHKRMQLFRAFICEKFEGFQGLLKGDETTFVENVP